MIYERPSALYFKSVNTVSSMFSVKNVAANYVLVCGFIILSSRPLYTVFQSSNGLMELNHFVVDPRMDENTAFKPITVHFRTFTFIVNEPYKLKFISHCLSLEAIHRQY